MRFLRFHFQIKPTRQESISGHPFEADILSGREQRFPAVSPSPPTACCQSHHVQEGEQVLSDRRPRQGAHVDRQRLGAGGRSQRTEPAHEGVRVDRNWDGFGGRGVFFVYVALTLLDVQKIKSVFFIRITMCQWVNQGHVL